MRTVERIRLVEFFFVFLLFLFPVLALSSCQQQGSDPLRSLAPSQQAPGSLKTVPGREGNGDFYEWDPEDRTLEASCKSDVFSSAGSSDWIAVKTHWATDPTDSSKSVLSASIGYLRMALNSLPVLVKEVLPFRVTVSNEPGFRIYGAPGFDLKIDLGSEASVAGRQRSRLRAIIDDQESSLSLLCQLNHL